MTPSREQLPEHIFGIARARIDSFAPSHHQMQVKRRGGAFVVGGGFVLFFFFSKKGKSREISIYIYICVCVCVCGRIELGPELDLHCLRCECQSQLFFLPDLFFSWRCARRFHSTWLRKTTLLPVVAPLPRFYRDPLHSPTAVAAAAQPLLQTPLPPAVLLILKRAATAPAATDRRSRTRSPTPSIPKWRCGTSAARLCSMRCGTLYSAERMMTSTGRCCTDPGRASSSCFK